MSQFMKTALWQAVPARLASSAAAYFVPLHPDHQERLVEELDILYVPVPPDLAELLGYDGDARLVAFYWNVGVDELAYHDGIDRGVGESMRFLEYAGHENVEAEITMNVGLGDNPAEYWLLLDRDNQNLYAGTSHIVRRLLIEQHDDRHQATVDAQRVELADEYREALVPDDPELEELVEYLDAWNAGDAA